MNRSSGPKRPSVTIDLFSPAVFLLTEVARQSYPKQSIWRLFNKILTASLTEIRSGTEVNFAKEVASYIELDILERNFWRIERAVGGLQKRPVRCDLWVTHHERRELTWLGASIGYSPRYVATRLIEHFIFNISFVAHKKSLNRIETILHFLEKY